MAVQLVRLCYTLALCLTFVGCASHESEEQAKVTYPRNVESCICRYLDLEEDNYSGLSYEDMVEDCNKTVQAANADRYSNVLLAEPKIEDLRCQEEVEPWMKEVAEIKRLQENNRALYQEASTKSSSEPEAPTTSPQSNATSE